MRRVLTVFCLIFLIGCGYKPVSRIAKETMSGSVFVDVMMSKTDPQNTVAIKDAIRQGIVQRLGMSLSDKNSAQTIVVASIKSLSFSELSYDQFGYVTSYRANLVVNFSTKLKNGEIFSKDCVGDYDFKVSRLVKNSSIMSDKDRYKAIENASAQAFDEFISALAIRGFRLERAQH